MPDTISFNKWFFLSMMMVVVSLTAYFSRMYPSELKVQAPLPLPAPEQEPVSVPEPPVTDEIKEHDREVMDDPLAFPTKRIDRSQIPPAEFHRMINISTRGYPDNSRLMGYLTRVEDGEASNRVIKLFGRQKYPRSSKYEYYTFLNSGQDQIKLPLEVKHDNELYDDDVVAISELNGTYTVKLYENETFRYYPDIY